MKPDVQLEVSFSSFTYGIHRSYSKPSLSFSNPLSRRPASSTYLVVAYSMLEAGPNTHLAMMFDKSVTKLNRQ